MRHKLLCLCCLMALAATAQDRDVHIRIIETSDVHGNYYPYDFIAGRPWDGGLSRVAAYVARQREALGRDHVVVLDNGDILQGQPSAYYYNFMDTTTVHACAAALNFIGYDAGTVGNHDVETGHRVYDRWVADCRHPVLGANVLRREDGQPYWKPYTLIEKDGVRIAVLGLLTPAIPQWLPENLWAGLRFDDMVEAARRWMPVLREEEKADIVVGLFHSGVGTPIDAEAAARGASLERMLEHASLQVAQAVPGFDVVLCGHDHRPARRVVVNVAGDSVLVLNPGADGMNVGVADITLRMRDGRVTGKRVSGQLADIATLAPDPAFCQRFASEQQAVRDFTDEVIGRSETALETRPAFFGPSPFVDFIHALQLQISGADLSFAAPLSFDAGIPAGDIRVADMFTLYKYENLLYVMRLTGQEVKDYLEYSYAGWTRQMRSAEDTLLLFRPRPEATADAWARLRTPSYNFDSAAGLCYTVDVRRPAGDKVRITGLADGRPFDLQAVYRVAINSYRGNGGGGLLTKGAGIPSDKLRERVVWSTDKDLRYYLMQEIRRQGNIAPRSPETWRFIPEDWVAKARSRDERILFSTASTPSDGH